MKCFSKISAVLLAVSFIIVFSACSKAEPEYSFPSVSDINEANIDASFVAEITSIQAETFDGEKVNDTSKPFYSYLPEGTVDYCSEAIITHAESGKDYRLLNFGKRVYENDVKVYKGKLPSSNTIIPYSLTSDGKYTSLTFQTDFKAPFTFELKTQEYFDIESGDFKIENPTFSYIEITFFYCTNLVDDFDFSNNRLISGYEIVQNSNNAVLKLFLRNEGAFYGWYADYNNEDMLVIKLLEPTKVYTADNEYGYALHDATIVVDAGHGGEDPGAMNGRHKESAFNLGLATKLKEELEKIGVTVVMTRATNKNVDAANRLETAYLSEADMIISVHRDSGSENGFNAFYFSPYSYNAAKALTDSTNNANLYSTVHKQDWHYFFLNRVSSCPAILTENGFITNENDLKNMLDNEYETRCAKALTAGIIEFYISAPF